MDTHHNSNSAASKFRLVTIEPAVLLFTIALNALGVTVQSYYVQTICVYSYQNPEGLNTGICGNLSQYGDAERLVQKEAGGYATWRVFIEAGPPILYGLIWGQLNDYFGSKFLLLIPMCGFLSSSILLLVSTQIEVVHPAFLLLSSFSSACTGGAVALTISALKYVVSISDMNNRTFRFAMVELAAQVGQPIGTLLGAQITKWGGYDALFLFTTALKVISVIYVLIFVKNNQPANKENICQLKFIAEAITVMFKKRKNKKILLVVVGAICLRVFAMNSIWTVSYFFTRLQMKWELGEFSTFITVDGIITAIGVMFVSMICIKMFKMSNTTLAIPILLNQIIGTLIWTFSTLSWHMYLGQAVQFAQGIISVLARSILSLVVPDNEIGKVFSFVTIMESVIPIISGPLHLKVYVATLNTFPGSVYALNAVYNTVLLLIFVWIRWSTRALAPQGVEAPNMNGNAPRVNGDCRHSPKPNQNQHDFIVVGGEVETTPTPQHHLPAN